VAAKKRAHVQHVTEFPPTAPSEGMRGDRHGWEGLQLKIWWTPSGWQSALYAPRVPSPQHLQLFVENARSQLRTFLRAHTFTGDLISMVDFAAPFGSREMSISMTSASEDNGSLIEAVVDVTTGVLDAIQEGEDP
jgi:hypothetical protein